jgi:ABC-type sugar transport system permease subunit
MSQLTSSRRSSRSGPDGVPTAGGPVRPRGDRSGRRLRLTRGVFDDRVLPWLLLAPAVILIVGLVGYPVLRTAFLSFTDADLGSLVSGDVGFVGIDNYREVVTDPHYRRVTITTVVFGLGCVVGTMVLGLAAALLLNRPFKGRTVLGVLVLLPWAMPRLAAATVWQWLFHDQYGIVNWFLTGIGLSGFEGYAWFNQRLSAFVAIGVVVVWQAFPFVAISLLAGLQSISTDVVEAARLDGAGAWQRLRFITLPMLKPLLLVLVVISTIWDFKVFDQVYAMTEGGPARSTEVLSITVWNEAFTRFDFGLASALAMAMFAILTAVTVLYIRLIREDEGL